MRIFRFLLAIFALQCFSSVYAQKLINIDFGAHTNPRFSVKLGKAAVGRTDNDFWNLYSRDGQNGEFLNSSQLLNLRLSDGTPTAADLFVTNAPGAWFTFTPDAMMESYLYPGGPNIDMHLASVPTGVYDIYVYAHGQPASENSVIQVISGQTVFGEKATSTAANWDSLGWQEGQRFVVFRNVAVDASQRLVVLSKPGSAGMSVINGIQLMEVPQIPTGPETIADWTFEEGIPGAIPVMVLDHTGNGNRGATFGGLNFVEGQSPGNGSVALRFNAGGFQSPSTSAFNFKNQNFIIEVILNPGPGNTGTNRGLVVAQNPENGAVSYVLDYRSEDRTVNFAHVDQAGGFPFVTATIPNDGRPHHIAAVRWGPSISIFLDKEVVQVRDVYFLPNPPDGDVQLRVGASSAGYNYDGTLERVRITRGSLSPGEFAYANVSSMISVQQQPLDLNVRAGGVAEFSIGATSALPLQYQWLFNNSPIPGKTNSTLRLEGVGASAVGRYSVRLDNGVSTVVSSEAKLTIYQQIADPLLNIDFGAHENPYFRSKGGPAAIGKSANDQWNLYSRDDGRGGWLENNQLLDLVWSDGTSSSIHLSVSNAGGAWYTLNKDPMFESYLYPLSRIGDINAIVSGLPVGTYDVFVYAHGQIPEENGIIRLSTDSKDFGLRVHSSSPGWDSPSWTEGSHFVVYRGVELTSGERLRIRSSPGQSGLSVINGMQIVRTGSSSGTDIVITEQPADANVANGTTAIFSVNATATSPARFQWYFNGSVLPGKTNTTLQLENASHANAGSYQVRIEAGNAATSSRAAKLQIFDPISDPILNVDFGAHLNPYFKRKTGPAAIGLQSADQWNLYSRDGANGVFLPGGMLTDLVWNDGTISPTSLVVTNAAGAWYTLNTDPMFESYLYPLSRSGPVTAHFSVLRPGVYDVYVYAHGQIPSENGVISVDSPGFSSNISYGPKSTSSAHDWDLPTWTEGKHYVLFRNVTVTTTGALRVTAHPGESRLAVINGIQLHRKTLTQSPEIIVNQQPQSAVVPLGEIAEFHVGATSGQELSYRWFKDGNLISGATSSVLRITNVALDDVGVYRAEIINASTTVNSSNASLNVFIPTDRPLLNIDFGAHENSFFKRKLGPAAIGKAVNDGWNLYSRDDGRGGWLANNHLEDLKWSDGLSSEIDIAVTNAAGAWYTINADAMFESYLYPLGRSGNIQAQISNLPGGVYDVYVYAHGQVPDENGVIELSTRSASYGTSSTSAASDWDKPSWSEGGEYVLFRGVNILPGEALQVISKPGLSGLSVINGMQLVLREGSVGPQATTVADWTFEEGVPGNFARTVTDYSVNSNHLSQIIGGNAAFTPTTNAQGAVSVRFPPGTGGFGAALKSTEESEFKLGPEFTIEASVHPGPDNSEFNRGIVVGQDAATGRLIYALDYRSDSRRVGFVVGDSQGRLDSAHAQLPADGKSHHVAGVLKDGILQIYVDGQLSPAKGTNQLALVNSAVVTLGANDIGGYWFNGTLDRVRLSRRALTPEEFFPHGIDPTTPLLITEGLQDAVVPAGTNAVFRVVVTGGTNLTYRWTFNGQVLSNETSNVLQLSDVRPGQAGTYRVVVTSGPWEVSSSASLTVLAPSGDLPVIVVHPESRQTGAGMSAPFSVLASSSSPLGFQWYFNGAPLPGETNSTLWVVAIDSADAGTYRVVLSNSTGSVSSRGAVLNVFDQSITGGEVYLDNHRDGIDAPVTDDSGNRISGPYFLAQLWAASPNQPLAPIGAAIPFGTGENAGYYSDHIARVVPGTTPGATVQAEVRVWDSRSGRSFSEAQADGGLHGTFGTFLQTLSGSANPARMFALRAFSLASRPAITQQPVDTSVSEGRTAFFEVRAVGSNPLSYQWRKNGIALEGETRLFLVLSNVTSAMAGSYTVVVRNSAGITTSEPAQLVVVPRDTQSPVVTLTSPTSGSTSAAHVTLAGSVADNNAVVRAEWSRDGQLVAPLILTNGQFHLPGIVLNPGTNTFSVQAYDADGNLGTASVSVFANLQRAVWIGGSTTVQEGGLVQLPIQINSGGDVGALSFTISYDTNQFTEVDFDWALLAGNPFFQANLEQPGLVRATYALPGRTIRAGTNTLARLTLRTRSVPETTIARVSLDLQGLYSAAGDPLLSGAAAGAAQIQITRREIIGDNNANDRLDVSDATAIIRMLTLVDPIRPWDITGNDLNQNTQLDAGDIVRVLRAVVNMGQPPVPVRGLSAQSVGARVAITSDKTQLVTGEKVTVRVALQDLDFPISGASFRLDYPTNALRLEDESSHRAGPIVPSSAMSLWNLSPEQNYALQDGHVNFAVSSAAPWTTNNGVLAEFTFTVLTNAATARSWSIQVSQAEAAAGLTLETLTGADLQLEGRSALPATVSVGTFNPETGTFQFSIQGEAGSRYRVEASEDLQTWTEVTIVTAENGSVTVSDTATAGASRRFYRLLAL